MAIDAGDRVMLDGRIGTVVEFVEDPDRDLGGGYYVVEFDTEPRQACPSAYSTRTGTLRRAPDAMQS